MNESLWLDEATTALVARMHLTEIFTKFLPSDFHPPIYYLIMKFWVGVFGDSEIALRVPSLTFAVLSVYLVYKLFGKIAAGLLLTAPLLFYYATEARMYTLTMFLVCYLIYSFVKKRWLHFSATLLLLGLTDYAALLIIPVFWIIGWRNRRKLLISHLPLFIGYLLWFPVFSRQIAAGLSASASVWGDLLGRTSLKNIFLIPIKFEIGRVGFDSPALYASMISSISLIFGYLLFKARKGLNLIWYWLGIPLVLAVIISFKIPILTYFRFLFVLPAFYILIARGIERSGRFKKKFFTLILCANVLFIAYYLVFPRFHREDWRGAAKAIGSQKVIMPADSQKEALIYYGKGSQIVKPSELTKKDKEIWLSRYVWEISDPLDSTRLYLERLGYNKVSEYDFNGVVFWKYANRN